MEGLKTGSGKNLQSGDPESVDPRWGGGKGQLSGPQSKPEGEALTSRETTRHKHRLKQRTMPLTTKGNAYMETKYVNTPQGSGSSRGGSTSGRSRNT